MIDLVHQHLICKAYTKTFFHSEAQTNKWLTRLAIDVLKMKVCIPARSTCVGEKGNYGYTGLIGLSTSHCSVHAWDEHGYIQLDIYSCKKFDSKDVFKFLKETLNVSSVEFSLYDRDNPTDFQHTLTL
jgi:S-adenosylmethionine/arginine decarboxylase-like enzyme